MPMMMMGSVALFLECDECWKLLLITKKGSIYLWDLFSRSCLLQDTLASLFAADPMASLQNAGKHMMSIIMSFFFLEGRNELYMVTIC